MTKQPICPNPKCGAPFDSALCKTIELEDEKGAHYPPDTPCRAGTHSGRDEEFCGCVGSCHSLGERCSSATRCGRSASIARKTRRAKSCGLAHPNSNSAMISAPAFSISGVTSIALFSATAIPLRLPLPHQKRLSKAKSKSGHGSRRSSLLPYLERKDT